MVAGMPAEYALRKGEAPQRASESPQVKQRPSTNTEEEPCPTIRVAHAHEQADDGRGRLDIGPLNESTAIQKEASRG